MIVDALDLLAFYNVEIIIRGEEAAFKCPFHNDRDPSANFNITTCLWTCFRCKIGGNAIDFVSLQEEWDYRQAEKWLRERYGGFFKPANFLREIERKLTKVDPTYYDEALLENYKHPTKYWDSRGISKKAQVAFELGYDPATARATIPIRSFDGRLVGLQARTLLKDEQNKYKFLLPVSKKRHLFGLHLIDHSDTVVVVEGVVPAIKFNDWGIPCVSTMGSSVSEEQASFLDSFDKVYMLYDNDDAGWYGVFGPSNKPKSRLGAWKKITTKLYIPHSEDYDDIDEMSKSEVQDILDSSVNAHVMIPLIQSGIMKIA